ncbi:MAG: FAD-dependent oxidoreductase [Planctomycetaceae bacterium]|nr:FAD-dependent oxidoreductase [Planctomycetaceae bacterium]
MSQHVVVIGGGVIGVACAHYLTNQGRQVTVIDRGSIGGACSHGNCGYISPSHVLPLTEPGIIGTALKSLFKKDAPFRVRPRLDFDLLKWFWNFARRCNYRDMVAAAPAIQGLLLSSLKLYEELITGEALDCEWERAGLLCVYRSREKFNAFEPTNVLLRDQFNAGARRIDADELATFEPALQSGMAGAWLHEEDEHLRPDKLMSEWRRVLTSRGVEFRENCAVTGFETSDRSARSIHTSEGELTADDFVVALGAWSPMLQDELGCRLPIQPGKGYSITMARPALAPQRPLIFPEKKVAITPWPSGYRIGSTMEFAGYDTTLRPERLELLRRGAAQYLREPCGEPVLEDWYGWRPMTWDSVPIIDRSPRLENVMIASGHNMLGISMATGTGRLVAELLTGQTPHLDPQPYSVRRFG